MDRFVCPPWYECACVLGKPVCKSTMLSHRQKANRKRASLGLGPFAWGPKVRGSLQALYTFDCHDSLQSHPSDINLGNGLVLRGRCFYLDYESCGSAATPQAHILPSISRTSPLDDSPGETLLGVRSYTNCGEGRPPACVIHQSTVSGGEATVADHLPPLSPSINNEDEEASATHNETRNATSLLCNESNEIGEPHAQRDSVHPGIDEENLPLNDTLPATARNTDLIQWMVRNRRWIELFHKHALQETFLDEALDILGAPCKQWKTIMSNVSHLSGLKGEMQVFSTCPGHMAFVPDPEHDDIPERCSECRKERPSSLHADSAYTYFPILPRLREMIRKQETCDELYAYRKSRISDANLSRDFYDGTMYQDICCRYGGEGAIENDIFLIASTDGFSPFKNRNYDVWSIAAINFNLPPHQRYMPQNVLPLSFVPGPRQPKDIQSFLIPLVREMRTAKDGIMMTFPDGSRRLVRVHLIGFTGDQPAVCKVSGLIGHNGKTPCRDCKIQGYFSGHYYFPSKIAPSSSRTQTIFNPRELPIRDENTNRNFIELIEGTTGAEKRLMQTDVGIREDSVLFKIPGMVPYSSFPHDVMHTFYNVQNELLRIMLGSFEDEFSLDRQLLSSLDEELVSWRWGISGQLGPAPKPISKYRDWKAAEHKSFSIAYSLVIFDGHLSRVYMDGLGMFSELVDICTRAEVSSDDICRVREVAVKFFEHFERCYYRYRPDRVDFCKSVFHVLLHLADCMERFGPLIGVSQYWVEGYIGWVGQRNNSRTRPGQSMIKNALFGEALKLFYDKMAYDRCLSVDSVIESKGYVTVGSPKEVWLQRLPDKGRKMRDWISDYFCRKYNLSNSDARSLSSTVTVVKSYARFRFLVGSDVQTASTFLRVRDRNESGSPIRSSSYISVEMQDDFNSDCEVWFGRLLKIVTFETADFESEGQVIPGRRYELIVADWAQKLRKGQQGQVYSNGHVKDAFSKPTAEDACVVNRLIKVVEHQVPGPGHTNSAATSSGRRPKTRAYFLDDAVRLDHLLTQAVSTDGVNRILKGFIR